MEGIAITTNMETSNGGPSARSTGLSAAARSPWSGPSRAARDIDDGERAAKESLRSDPGSSSTAGGDPGVDDIKRELTPAEKKKRLMEQRERIRRHLLHGQEQEARMWRVYKAFGATLLLLALFWFVLKKFGLLEERLVR